MSEDAHYQIGPFRIESKELTEAIHKESLDIIDRFESGITPEQWASAHKLMGQGFNW